MALIKDWNFFWDNREKFKLGHLTTEKPNPKTVGLAEVADADLSKAVEMIRAVDIDAINKVKEYGQQINDLKADLIEVMKSGKIYISGCGATGRLAMFIESLWKSRAPNNLKEKVIGFMAGGDGALVRSVEGFEDYEEYAIRHIKELGFTAEDIMLGVTEGGETPFVLSTVEYAREHSKYNPWLIYCNGDDLLANVKRSDDLIKASDVKNVCIEIGSMALAGSTRMQATSVQTLFVGLALFSIIEDINYAKECDALLDALKKIDCNEIAKFTAFESNCYKQGGYATYLTDSNLGLTVLTDTTERTPTFSVNPFENINHEKPVPSYCYLSVKDSDKKNVWNQVLNHEPRTLEWDFSKSQTGVENLRGYDISSQVLERRSILPNHQVIEVSSAKNAFVINYADTKLEIKYNDMSELSSQVLIKMVMNSHSTLVMARLGRFTSNIMTFVTPGNNKLIDRATRYVEYLLDQDGIGKPAYDDIARKIHEVSLKMDSTDTIVMKTYKTIVKGL